MDNGCHGVPGSMRATEDSPMNGSIPIMGSVNRRWAERVLSLWQGCLAVSWACAPPDPT